MKTFTAATLLALAAVATAQLPDIPDCALTCFITPLTSDGCENLEDFGCHCKKADSLFAAVTPCVKESCTPEEEAEVIQKVKDTCAENGVTVDIPAASATPTPTATTSELYSTTIMASYSAGETSSELYSTTIMASYSAGETPITSELYSTTILASFSSGSPNATANGTLPTGSPSVTEFPGAAARATQAVGLLGAAAFAMLAL